MRTAYRHRPFLQMLATISFAALAGCRTVPTVTGCSALAETVLGEPVEHPQIGNSGDEATDWQILGVAYAGALNQSEDMKRTGLEIIRACEARDREITQRPPWRFW